MAMLNYMDVLINFQDDMSFLLWEYFIFLKSTQSEIYYFTKRLFEKKKNTTQPNSRFCHEGNNET